MKLIEKLLYILLLLYFIIVSICKLEFIPDFLNLTNHFEPHAIYDTIIGTIATVLGLIAIVFIVYFDFLKEYSLKKSSNYFIESIQFKRLLTTSILTIVISFLGLITTRKEMDPLIVSQLYTCIIMFFASLYLVIPFVKSFIQFGDIKEYTLKLVEDLTENKLTSLLTLNHKYSLEDQIKIDESELGVIREIGRKHVANDNTLACKLLINNLTQKIISSGKVGNIRNETGLLIDLYLYVLDGIRDESIKNRNEQILTTIINSIFKLYEEGAEKKRELINFENLEDSINELIDLLFNSNLIGPLKHLNSKIKNNIYLQMTKNCPDESQIYDVFNFEKLDFDIKENASMEDTMQWERISENYVNQFQSIYKRALDLKLEDLASKCGSNARLLSRRILTSNLEDNLKGILIWLLHQSLSFDLSTYAESNKLSFQLSQLPVLKPSDLSRIIEQEKSYSHRLIEIYYELLRDLLKSKSIRYLLPSYKLGGIAKICTEKYSKSNYFPDLLNYHITYLDYFRTIIEPDIENQYRNYDRLKSEMQNTKSKIIKNIKDPPDELIKLIDKKLSKFKSTAKFKRGENIFLERKENES